MQYPTCGLDCGAVNGTGNDGYHFNALSGGYGINPSSYNEITYENKSRLYAIRCLEN